MSNLNITFVNVLDQNSLPLKINKNLLTLAFQRGKILNNGTQGGPQLVDAIAGLQYLSNLRSAGLGQGEVNVTNMASILPSNRVRRLSCPLLKTS